MSGEELKACGHCGAAARVSLSIQSDPPLYAVGCSECIIMTEWDADEAVVAAAWNRRNPLPEQPREGMRDHLEAYQVLRGFMCSLTNGGRNRATHLSINHDELRGLLAEADKVCTAQSLAFRSPPSTETKESGDARHDPP